MNIYYLLFFINFFFFIFQVIFKSTCYGSWTSYVGLDNIKMTDEKCSNLINYDNSNLNKNIFSKIII